MAWKCVYSSRCHYGKKSIYFIKQHMKYTFSRIKKKRKSLREIFVYHLLFNICFRSCKFIIHNRNTRLRYSTWEYDELISHSKYIIGSDGNVNIAEFLRPPVSRTSANDCFYQILFWHNQSKGIWLLHNLFF